MTEYLTVDGGTIAYDVTGEGPLVVLAHGMGDSRHVYRFVVPQLVAAGYRVAAVDLRGCGESSVSWPTYSRTAIAGDLLALVRHLGGPAVLVGNSISGGAATIAAADAPDLIAGIVEMGTFTRKQTIRLADFRVKRFRRGMVRLLGAATLGNVNLWKSYLDVAYPGVKPPDWADQMRRVDADMRRPGRMKVLRAMGNTPPTDAGARLGDVRCPALIIQGSLDPDWASPQAEGEAVVAALPQGTLEIVEGAGHYPQAQFPDRIVALLLPFLAQTVRA